MSVNAIPNQFEQPDVMMRMRSGRWMNLYDPSLLDVDLDDFVYGTSRTPRFGGQCKGETSYNVLQHHELVDDILVEFVSPKASKAARLCAMGHDLHEGAGLGDVVTPYGKLFNKAGLKELKGRLDRVILPLVGLAFPIDPAIIAAVKRADKIAAVSEAIQLCDWPEDIARKRVGDGYRGRIWERPIIVLNEQDSRASWRLRLAAIQAMPG